MGRQQPHTRGQSLVELALLLPVLMWVAAGVVDFGRVYYYDITAINAARAGVRVAADPRNSDGLVQSAAQADASPTALTVTVSPPYPRSSGDTATVTVSYSFALVTPLVALLFPGGQLTVSRSASMVVF